MCLQDIKIGRKSWKQETQVLLTSSLKELVPNNPYRTSITFSGDANNDWYLTTNPKNTGGVGIYFQNVSPIFTLDVIHHGGLVTGAWYAIQGGGQVNVTILESFFDADDEV